LDNHPEEGRKKMDIGMLWYDDDAKRQLDEKVARAAEYYRAKYGVAPTECYVHPGMLGDSQPAVAAGVPPARLVRDATTVMVSFSKGLGCPVGSCLAGPRALIEEAWHARARFGGAMRQTGVLTAACLYALDHNLERLGEDHAHAELLANRLREQRGFTVVSPETNIVMLDLRELAADVALAQLAAAGVKLSRFGSRRIRAVTHLNVSREDVERAAEIIVGALGG